MRTAFSGCLDAARGNNASNQCSGLVLSAWGETSRRSASLWIMYSAGKQRYVFSGRRRELLGCALLSALKGLGKHIRPGKAVSLFCTTTLAIAAHYLELFESAVACMPGSKKSVLRVCESNR